MKCLQNWLQQSLLCSFLVTMYSVPTFAQIRPDNTLGSENSRVVPNLQINGISLDVINGGAERGVNLFHSFSDFNIGERQRVYFVNPSGVQNILTRVTGGSTSNILGTLGVAGTANLYLINPSGILFGNNASLDIQGSFVGTTANGIKFDTQGLFSATKPEAPGLLTVNPSALLFSQIQANAGITNLSQAPAGVNPLGQDIRGLRAVDGKSLLLVGGNVNINSGGLRAYGGNVELAGIAAVGEVGLKIAGDNISLNVPELQRADIALSNGAEINVRGASGGSITIHGADVNLTEESKLRAGFDTNLGTSNSQAGNIVINSTGIINLTSGSFIANIINEGSSGKPGDIKINTGSLNLETSQINASTSGQSNAGNVFIQVKDNISLTNSAIFSAVNKTAVGNGGNIVVEGGSLSLVKNSELEASTFGQGSAGNITVNVRDGIRLTDTSDISNSVREQGVGQAGKVQIQSGSLALEGFSFIDNSMGDKAVGTGGGILIDTGSLTMKSGAQLSGLTSGSGNIGNITIKANDITFKDSVRLPDNSGIVAPSGIFTRVEKQATGNIGNISIQAKTFSISDDASIATSTRGQGKAGNIFIQADRLELARSLGALNSSVEDGSSGRGGNIQLQTGVLSFSQSAGIDSSTVGTGDAGAIIVDTDSLIMERPTSRIIGYISGEMQTSLLSGQINANTALSGKGGDITINAHNNIYIDKGDIFSSVLDGGSLIPNFRGTGNGGNINITAGSLQLVNNTIINTQSSGQASAGNISIKARDTVSLDSKSLILSSLTPPFNNSVTRGQAGNIDIDARVLFVTNGSSLFSSTGGQGNAGQIKVNTTDQVVINSSNGIASGFLSSVFPGGTGKGGDIQITTGSLLVDSQGYLLANSTGNGDAGNIIINARDLISLNNNSTLSTNTFERGSAGNIHLSTGILTLTNGALLFSGTSGNGKGGDITINARDLVKFDGSGNNQNPTGAVSKVESTGVGNAGNITVKADSVLLKNGGQINTAIAGRGDAGNININARNTVNFDGIGNNGRISGAYSVVENNGVGRGGDIKINGQTLSINRGGVSSSSFGQGTAGNIDINSATVRLDNASAIAAITNSGNGGNINLTANDFLLLRRSSFISTTAGTASLGGDGGNITIDTPFIVAVPNENSDITANAFTGKGGNIDLTIQTILGIEPRANTTLESDITASSQFGTQGQINIIQPEIQPIQELAELPEQVVDASNQIGQICPRGANFAKPLGEFTITGRGSLPPSPLEPLAGTTTTTALVGVASTSTSTENLSQPTSTTQTQFIEAQGWVKGTDGNITLVAMAPNSATPKAISATNSCP